VDVLNLQAALDRVGGDQELLEEVAQLFLESAGGMLELVQAAAAMGDPRALERAAHALKGSVGNFGAEPAHQAALRLEQMGRKRELVGVDEALSALVKELDRLRPALVSALVPRHVS